MNVNDAEILDAIMQKSGYEKTGDVQQANAIFLVTVTKHLLSNNSVQYARMPRLESGIGTSCYFK